MHRKPSTASIAFHSNQHQRFSKTGSMMHPLKDVPSESMAFGLKSGHYVTTELADLSAKLEEIREKKDLLINHHATRNERRLYFENKICKGKVSETRIIFFDIVDSSTFQNIMFFIIVLNSVLMIIENWDRDVQLSYGYLISYMEPVFLACYIFEAILKIFVMRGRYFVRGWDLFDFVIVLLSVAEYLPEPYSSQEDNNTTQEASGSAAMHFVIGKLFKTVKITRVLKGLRTFKLLRMMENIKLIYDTVIKATLSMTSIIVILLSFLMFFTLVGHQLFSRYPNFDYFKDFSTSFITLLQVLTLDDWFEVFTTGNACKETDFDTTLCMFLIAYIIISYFICLNLFIAVFVDKFQISMQKKESKQALQRQVEQEEQQLLQKVEGGLTEISDVNLRARLAKLNSIIGQNDEETPKGQDYESSDSELDADEIKDIVLDDIIKSASNGNEKEIETTKWCYRLLASIEKHQHIMNDQITVHDRIIELLVDDQEDVLQICM